MSSISERILEDEISTHLVSAGGYQECKIGTEPEWRPNFDAALGLDTVELFRFIDLTQGSEWQRLVKAHGGHKDLAYRKFSQRLVQQIDERGTVDVLRHGVRDQNVEIRLSYRKPAFGVAPELVAHYDANRLTVTRQLPFDPDSNQDDRPLPVPQRHTGCHGRAQEPSHRPKRRARNQAVPNQPRSKERHAGAPRTGPFRCRPRFSSDNHQAGRQIDEVPAF